MSFHSYMETFAEAWVAANTTTAVSLQLPPRSSPDATARPLRASEVQTQELPTMLSKNQLVPEQASPLPLNRSPAHPPISSPDHHHHHHNPHVGGPLRMSLPEDPHHVPHLSPTPSPLLLPSTIAPAASSSQLDQKTVAVHCVIEPAPIHANKDEAACLKKDTYVVLPGFTPFMEVVQAVLLKMGYSNAEAIGAKGSIMIKDWKPLSFDAICRDPDATVEKVLGDLTNVVTLKIKLFGYDPDMSVEWNDQAVRCAVNELLKEMNQCKLARLSPLSQSTISNIANSKYLARIGPEKCREFGTWHQVYRQSQLSDPEGDEVDSGPKDTRLTFHPIYELPRMRDWYKACKNPSDQILRRFLDEINEGHVRQQRPKITLTKLKIWWKNEKQREKRLQQKQERGIVPKQSETNNQSLGCSSEGLGSLEREYRVDPQQMANENPNMSDMRRDPMLSHT